MKNNIIVPEGWNEVSLSKFQELQALDRMDENYDAECISILCDMDIMEVERLDIQTYAKILANLVWLIKLPTEAEYKPIITVKGEQYGLVKLSSLTNGEWYSLETWLEEPNKNLHRICAMLYRPLITAINDDYRILEDYKTETALIRANLFKEVPVSDLYGAVLFFSVTEKTSTQTMKEYLEVKILIEMMPKILRMIVKKKWLRKFSQEGPRGIPFFTHWQKVILRKYLRSQNSTLSSPLVTEPSK